MSALTRAIGIASGAAALLFTLPAFADGPPPAEQPTTPAGEPPPPATPPPTTPLLIDQTPPLGLFPPGQDALIDPRMARSWGVAPERLFVATTVDVGFIYLRPRASFGYGKPFTKWVGVDLNPLAQSAGLGAYGGLRVEIPYLDVRAGARYFRSFQHAYLTPATEFDRISLEVETATPAHVVTYETELDSSIPVGPGNIVTRASLSYVTGVPAGKYVFEETLHVIVNPPWVWRVRGGYMFRLGKYSQHSIGIVADFLDVPNRDDSKTVRVGPLLRWVLSRRVEVRGSFVLTVVSPDRIGLAGSDFTELGVRYRWATE